VIYDMLQQIINFLEKPNRNISVNVQSTAEAYGLVVTFRGYKVSLSHRLIQLLTANHMDTPVVLSPHIPVLSRPVSHPASMMTTTTA